MKIYPLYAKEYVQGNQVDTYCFLLDENKHVVSAGISFQNKQDQFNRRLGNKIALGRALKAAIKKQNLAPTSMDNLLFAEFKGLFQPGKDPAIRWNSFAELIEKKKFNEKEAIDLNDKVLDYIAELQSK
jgi:hypothetical protein